MRNINIGCGANRLEGWENYDLEVDIRQALPFENNSIDCIFAEHVVEHVTPQEAFLFFEDCYKALKIGGKIRICVPSINSIYANYTDRYGYFVSHFTECEPTRTNAVKAILFQHGHQSAWNEQLLDVMLKTAGFITYQMKPEHYHFAEFIGCDGHQKVISPEFNNIETVAIEGLKTGMAL